MKSTRALYQQTRLEGEDESKQLMSIGGVEKL
jgi:hypothetical protein